MVSGATYSSKGILEAVDNASSLEYLPFQLKLHFGDRGELLKAAVQKNYEKLKGARQ